MTRVIESFVESKQAEPALCEDSIVECNGFLAVFDGATDKTDARYAGVPGGRFAVDTLARALAACPSDIGATDCIAELTQALREEVAAHGPASPPEDSPSASAVIYSAARSEIWQVGDCSWRIDDVVGGGSKRIDQIVAAARSALLRALLHAGKAVNELRASDPGRAMVMPLLEEQHRFRNLVDPASELAFGALDGNPVPERFIDVMPTSSGAEIVLATDGYPRLLQTLAQSEEYLRRDIEEDPLRIGRHPSTKAVAPQHKSFDDRAYLRFAS